MKFTFPRLYNSTKNKWKDLSICIRENVFSNPVSNNRKCLYSSSGMQDSDLNALCLMTPLILKKKTELSALNIIIPLCKWRNRHIENEECAN